MSRGNEKFSLTLFVKSKALQLRRLKDNVGFIIYCVTAIQAGLVRW